MEKNELALVPEKPLRLCDLINQGKEKFQLDFLNRWMLTYQELSIPMDQRLKDRAVIVNYCQQIIDKFMGVPPDVIFRCWNLGVLNYYQWSERPEFPVFNVAVLVMWIEQYRNDVIKKLYPPAAPPKELPKHNATVQELWASFNTYAPEVQQMVCSLPGPDFTRMFKAISNAVSSDVAKEIQLTARKKYLSEFFSITESKEMTYSKMTFEEKVAKLKAKAFKMNIRDEKFPNEVQLIHIELMKHGHLLLTPTP